MNIGIWVVGISNFKNLLKNKLVTGKNLSFVMGQFSTPHSICLNTGFYQAVVYENIEFPILLFSTKRQFFRFRKDFVLQKICSKNKVLETLKIYNNCQEKHANLSNRKLFWKILSSFFSKKVIIFLYTLKWNI